MTSPLTVTMAECDCQIAGICYNMNHRGETMHPGRGRSKSSFGPRCRGLGEVRSLRSSSQDVRASPELTFRVQEEQENVTNMTDSFETFPPTRQTLAREGSISDANWLSHPEFGLVNDDIMASTGEKPVNHYPMQRPSSELSSHCMPVLKSPIASTLPNYLYYTRRSHPNLSRVGLSDFETPEDNELIPEIAVNKPGHCGNCGKLLENVRVISRDCDMLRIRNNSLQKQLQSYKKCVSSLETDDISDLHEAYDAEIEALNDEIASMRELLTKSSGNFADENEMSAIDSVRSLILEHLQSKQTAPQIEKYQRLLEDVQMTLMKDRESARQVISATESRLVEENARLLAAIKEQEHAQNLSNARITQKQALNYKLQSQITKLKAELGLIDGVLPKLNDEEKTILFSNWCDISESVKDSLKSGSSIAELIGERESITTPEELIQCLWYRYRYSSKALSELQSELENIGLKNEDQLDTLREIDLLLIEKDEKIKTLNDELQTEQASTRNVVKEYAVQIKRLTEDKNVIGDTVKELEDKLRLETVSSKDEVVPTDDSVDEALELALTELSTAYDVATVKQGLSKLQQENEKLNVELRHLRETNKAAEIEIKSLVETKQIPDEDSNDLQLYEAVDELTSKFEHRVRMISSEGEPLSDSDSVTLGSDGLLNLERLDRSPSNVITETSTPKFKNKKTETLEKLRKVVENLTTELAEQKQKFKSERKMRMKAEEAAKESTGFLETKNHLEHVKEELTRCNEDRKELRSHVTELTRQITDVSTRQIDIMSEKERELSEQRHNLQDAQHKVEDIKNQLEREKRNAADLKVTYHKEIKNQGSTAKREFDLEIDALHKELVLAQKSCRSSEHEKDRLLDEAKLLSRRIKSSEKFLINAKKVCQELLQTKAEGSDKDTSKNTSQFLRALEEVQQALKGDQVPTLDDESNWLVEQQPIKEKRTSGQSTSRHLSDNHFSEDELNSSQKSSGSPASQLQMYTNQTQEISSDMMGRIRALESYSLIDSAGMKQCLLDLTAKYDMERSLLKNHLNKSSIDLKSYKARMEALDETKRTLQAACDAYEVKLEQLQSELNKSKKINEDYNKIITEYEALKEKYNTVSRNFKELKKRYKTEQDAFTQKVRTSDETVSEAHKQIERLTEKREKLKESLIETEKENNRLKSAISDERSSRKNENIQLEQKFTTMQSSLNEVQKELKIKKTELTQCQERLTVSQSEYQKLTVEMHRIEEKYRSEHETCVRLKTTTTSLEDQLTSTKHLLTTNQSDKEVSSKLQIEIGELRDQLAETKSDLLKREQEMRLKEQQIEWQKQHATETDSQLTRERSLHVATRSRVEALEDEAEWLRTQLSACKQKGGEEAASSSAGKSRAEQINEIILRSQSRAQAMLANNPEGFGTFAPPGGPGSEMAADQMSLSLTSRSMVGEVRT